MKLLMVLNPKTIFLYILLGLFTTPQLVWSQFHMVSSYCLGNMGNYTTNSTYQNNLNVILPLLTKLASVNSFGNYSTGRGIDKVDMLYNCQGDLTGQECHDCVQLSARTIVEHCPTEKEAIVWYQECMLRYANRSIFAVEEESPFAWDYSTAKVLNPQFGSTLGDAINELIQQAAYNGTTRGYAIGEVDVPVLGMEYLLVQCTPDILGEPCERCLLAALRSMGGCCGTDRQTLEFYFPSCQIRYDTAPFVEGTGGSTPPLPVSPPIAPDNSLLPPPLPLPRSTTISPGGSTSTMIRSDRSIFLFGLVAALSMLFAGFTSY